MSLRIVISVVITIVLFQIIIAEDFGPQRSARSRKQSYSVPPRKPNIILILTDDQDVELGSMNFMPKTLKSIKHKGAECRHAYVTTPMCCPSRSSLLTGMYVHNHNVYTNNDNCSSTHWQTYHETRSFATYLSNVGYRTGYFGKYLNKYNGSYIPPGWREWGGLIMNSKFYNYSINMNGKKIKHGFDYHKDYYPDLIVNDSIAFLRHTKKTNANKPVMLTMSFPAPHGPEDSAPQYSHMFFNVTTHHTPSYDHAPNPDKQWILQITKKMQPIHRQFTDLLMTKRLQTLQSVDSAVQRVVDELERLGELDNTYIVYTSDHGYHLGQFGLIKGKSFPFEFDVRVPFLIRGPGVEAGTIVDDIVLNIDLAPTFLAMAGVERPPHMDGRSVLPLFLNKGKRKWPDTFLIESSGRRDTPESRRANRYSAAANGFNFSTPSPFSTSEIGSTGVSSFTTTTTTSPPKPFFESGEEISDDEDDDVEQDDDIDGLDTDDEVNDDTNLEKDAIKATDVQNIDNRLLPELSQPANKLERLARECTQDEFKTPCVQGQQWYCEYEHGRWRKHKCKSQFSYNKTSHKKTHKKCACFTAEKLVYKKLAVKNHPNSQPLRVKRDTQLHDIIFHHLHDDNIAKMTHRVKRDSLAHVDSVLESIQHELTGLQKANASLREVHIGPKINIQTNSIDDVPHGCVRVSKGNVNCSSEVYQNRKTWKRERQQIEMEIQRLKQKLDGLKEIRKHLKHAKPEGEDDTSEEVVANGSSNNIVDNSLMAGRGREVSSPTTERTEIFTNGSRRKGSGRRRTHVNEFNITDFDDLVNETDFNMTWTTDRYDLSTRRPIRHNHTHRVHPTRRRQEITTRVDETSTTSSVTPSFADIFNTASPKMKLTTERPSEEEHCYCAQDEEEDLERERKRKIKEERMSKKARKQRKKAQMEKECTSEKIHCFRHDNDHWKTAPLWTAGPFCFCMNANNNTYNCLRTINSTHDLLYCEFVTGMVTYYNLRMDPFELQNRVDSLKPEEKSYLHDQLKALMACRGKDCTLRHTNHHQYPPVANRRPTQFQNAYLPNPNAHRPKKRRYNEFNGRGGGESHGIGGRYGRENVGSSTYHPRRDQRRSGTNRYYPTPFPRTY